jgi:hypothetical protein
VGNRLMTMLLTLDNELPSDLDRLVALRSECFAGRGFDPRLRLIHRIEFDYAETLRCSADNGTSFSHAWTGQETTAGRRHGAGHPRYIRIKRSLVDDFAFGDEISLRLVVLASLGTALSTAFQPSLGEADSADLDADLGGDNAAHFVCPRGHIHRPHSKPFRMAVRSLACSGLSWP